MVDIDLDIVMGKQPTIKINGENYQLKDLTVEEHLESEHLIQSLNLLSLTDKKNIKKSTEIIKKYLMIISDMPEDVASKVKIVQFQRIRKYITRKELYDQGFTDREIDKLESKALKNQIAQL
jgi:hypothetical protein